MVFEMEQAKNMKKMEIKYLMDILKMGKSQIWFVFPK